MSENFETEVGSVKEKGKREISLINHINGHYFFVSPALEFLWWSNLVKSACKSKLQWLSMVWDKIPMIWDIIELANYSLDWHDDLTKSEHHGNSNVADTKN